MPDSPARWIDYMAVADLPVDPRNPKAHADDDIDASMDRFGYTEPVLLDERTGLLVAGHGRRSRLLAKRALGEEPPEGVSVVDGEWMVPVVRGWASADDAEAAAYLVASNRLTESGGWEHDPLLAILEQLNEGPGLVGTGYTPDDLEDLLAAFTVPTLDELEEEHGAPDPEQLWPVLRFKVPPDLRSRYLELVAEVDGGDAAQFLWLVERAEG